MDHTGFGLRSNSYGISNSQFRNLQATTQISKHRGWLFSTHPLPSTLRASDITSSAIIKYEIMAKAEYPTSTPGSIRQIVTETTLPIRLMQRRSTPITSPLPQIVDQFVEITIFRRGNGTYSSRPRCLLSRLLCGPEPNIIPREFAKLQPHAPSSMEIEKPLSLLLEYVSEGESGFSNPTPQIRVLSIKHKIKSSIWVRTFETAESRPRAFVERELVTGLDRHFIPISTRSFKAKIQGRALAEGGYWIWEKSWVIWFWMRDWHPAFSRIRLACGTRQRQPYSVRLVERSRKWCSGSLQ